MHEPVRSRFLCLGILLGHLFVGCGGDDSSPVVPKKTKTTGKGGATSKTTTDSGGADASGGTSQTGSGGSQALGGADNTLTGGTSASTNANGGATLGDKGTPNLFTTLSGKTAADVDAKVTTAVNRFFGIGTGEATTPTAATGYRCYYELPQDTGKAFIWAADSDDVRSEGMSYGMMIAVQMDLHTQFDRLWSFAKTYMQYPSNASIPTWKYYFRWQGKVNRTSTTSWTPTFAADTSPAPDGDEYFAAALYLADKRWGSSGTFNYKLEADNIASAMLHNTASGSRYPIIHQSQNMVVFVPIGTANNFTDPSYHLPAFYELFALYGPAADSAKWKSIAATSRKFLVSSAHTTTGLHPDYATFAGAPTTSAAGDGHDKFQYDAWRVIMNMGVDYAWFSADPTMKAQAEKYHAFFTAHLTTNNVTNCLFQVDGSSPSGGGSTALTATLAAGALASAASNRATYVNNLWGVAQQAGQYRYYQESVYLLGLLAVAGKYRYSF